MTDGIKHDGGKVQPVLVLETMARALQAVCEVGTFGAQKYSADNWLQVADASSRYRNAKHRHMLAAAAGETHDSESGLLHAAHEAWNALAALELMLRGVGAAAVAADWDKGEQRIDRIAASAGDGEHYNVLMLPEDFVVPEHVKFISVLDNGQAVGHVNKPILIDNGGELCWNPQGENVYLGLLDSGFGLYEFIGDHWILTEAVV